MSTATLEQITSEEWLNSLKYCICGSRVIDDTDHKGCIVSGISRKIFPDYKGWLEYSILNGKMVAEFYRASRDSLIQQV